MLLVFLIMLVCFSNNTIPKLISKTKINIVSKYYVCLYRLGSITLQKPFTTFMLFRYTDQLLQWFQTGKIHQQKGFYGSNFQGGFGPQIAVSNCRNIDLLSDSAEVILWLCIDGPKC